MPYRYATELMGNAVRYLSSFSISPQERLQMALIETAMAEDQLEDEQAQRLLRDVRVLADEALARRQPDALTLKHLGTIGVAVENMTVDERNRVRDLLLDIHARVLALHHGDLASSSPTPSPPPR